MKPTLNAYKLKLTYDKKYIHGGTYYQHYTDESSLKLIDMSTQWHLHLISRDDSMLISNRTPTPNTLPTRKNGLDVACFTTHCSCKNDGTTFKIRLAT